MKAAIATFAILAATPAFADPGHFAEARGHSHWLAAGALGLAFLIAGAALWRERRARKARRAAEKKA
jgi:hypothetical protein